MMTNLFSIFDPSTSNSLSLNWLSTILFILFTPCMYWMIPSRYQMLISKMFLILNKEFSILLSTSKKPGMTFMLISLFWFILMNNFMGLMPYIFTSTSHIMMTLSLAFPAWMTIMIFGWLNNTNHMFSHLVPQGTPSTLMVFMVCIETISNLIRPITLSIRLAANMIAGHLLMTLLSNSAVMSNIFPIISISMAQITLLLLEMAVAFIQAYVFVVLTSLYSTEIH
ncbi:ATP synthase F0 subunit 6 (mitochondrion) [Tachypleus tridentatus]|uniref:ATP synthase subunit a n=1 Tax=Tachypleus tridentatus TaxID=6853 RepID=C1KRJ6_TACTR|nr:ATP synthase F0 subunit 6 [Tachypleus tridentatus]ACO52903.1 ATP synthase F0 subunit 6 [Tachypleus tridentatus]AFH09297.1 ATP synthase F0 subunit 6 [Tachypleus tridentatus]WGU45257.1 ATP synthase F0 subunit 6 [Tachypleus tridentatus]